MDDTNKAYLQLHIAVFLFGFTAILGAVIDLPAVMIVWWRVLLTCISFLFLLKGAAFLRKYSRQQHLRWSGIGVLTGLHWLFFFLAIQYSNASITLVALATTSLFTAFIEPLILRKKIKWSEVIIGVIVVPGMILIAQNIDQSMIWGLGFGFVSAILASLFNTLNKKYVVPGGEREISFIELSAALAVISLALPIVFYLSEEMQFWPQGMDWVYLIILAIICTTLAFVLALKALNHISAFASTLTVNLEPIYGIILAAVLLNEHQDLNMKFYIGVIIILGAIIIYPLLAKRNNV